MIKEAPKFFLPAGATPNELAATGPGSSAATEWQAAHTQSLVLQQSARDEATARRQVLDADRADVLTAFLDYARRLAAQSSDLRTSAATAGAAVGLAYGATRPASSTEESVKRAGAFAVLFAFAGLLFAKVTREVAPPPAPPAVLPVEVEARLRGGLGPDVPGWRVAGWQTTWAELAAAGAPPALPAPTSALVPVARAAASSVTRSPLGSLLAAIFQRRR